MALTEAAGRIRRSQPFPEARISQPASPSRRFYPNSERHSALRNACFGREGAINLRQLRYFAKVEETGNITRAARDLNVSQPSLGVQIKLLEDELGIALLDRHSRGITPTLAGTLLGRRAREILHQIDNLGTELRDMGSKARRKLVLGLPPSIIKLIGHELIVWTMDEMPQVELSLVEDRSPTLVKAMERDEIDLAFVYEVEERHDMVRRAVLQEELVFVTTPDLAPRDGVIGLSEALSSKLAIAGGRGLIRRLVEREAQRLGIELHPAFEIHSVSTLHLLLEESKAVGIMPFGLAAEHQRRGNLACSRIDPPVRRILYTETPAWRQIALGDGDLERLTERVVERLVASLGPFGLRLDEDRAADVSGASHTLAVE